MTIFLKAQEISQYTIKTRRRLHQIPELAFQEFETAKFVIEQLKQMDFEVKEGVGGTGVVALFDSGRPGKTLMLRFDMDGLPVQEDTAHTFASLYDGRMHACGHDGHMAVGLSLARLLRENPDEINGKVLFVFQPAEEIGQGAKAMIADGLFDFVPVDYALAVHLWAEKPFGWVAIPDGPVMGGSSDLMIDVAGKGGHAAKPDLTIDPLYIASQIIVALQSVVSRSISPSQSAVVSITQMEASDRRNIISNKARMAGTIRWFDNQTRELIEERIESIAKGIAESFGADADVLITESTIPVNNQTYISNICRQKLEDMRVDVEELVVDSHYRTNLSEDFAYIIDRIPGAMLLIGAGQKVDGKIHPHHHPKFDIDEKAMTLAIAALFETIKALT
jgi:amidohydrolase